MREPYAGWDTTSGVRRELSRIRNAVTKMTDFERDQEEQIIEGQILSEDDQTMLNLPPVPFEDEFIDDFDVGEYSEEYDDYDYYEAAAGEDETVSDSGRRHFLTRVLLGGVAATALGGSAALLYEQHGGSAPNIAAMTSLSDAVRTQPTVAANSTDVSQLRSALQAITADRDRLNSELQQRNAELAEARQALEVALAELDAHKNLNSLWQQLDEVGLDVMMGAAVAAMGGNLQNLARLAALLREGLEVGRAVTDWFIGAMLRPQTGIQWLQRQVNALATSIDWLLEQVRDVVQPAANLSATLMDFVIKVLDRLPFNFGSRAEAGLNAMRTVVDQLPELIRGINDDVLDPLADWFGTDEGRNLQGMLVRPVIDNVFVPAQQVLAKIDEVDTVFTNNVAQPVETAIAERQTLRERIREAQSKLGINSDAA